MITTCFVGLSNGTDDQSLREAFTNYGEVVEGKWLFFFTEKINNLLYKQTHMFSCAARVIMDRETGRSRSFGFVTFTSNEDASAAISGMDGKVHILDSSFCLLLVLFAI